MNTIESSIRKKKNQAEQKRTNLITIRKTADICNTLNKEIAKSYNAIIGDVMKNKSNNSQIETLIQLGIALVDSVSKQEKTEELYKAGRSIIEIMKHSKQVSLNVRRIMAQIK